MVYFTSFIGIAAILSQLAGAIPIPDSAIGDEVAVSAPNGIILSDTAALASRTRTSTASMSTQTSMKCEGSGCQSSSMSSDNSSSSSMSSSSSCEGSGCNSSMGSSSSSCEGSGCNSSMGSSSSSCEGSGCNSSMGSSSSSCEGSGCNSGSMYGSGSSNWNNWGGSGYNDCVSQCIAKFGSLPSEYTPSKTSESSGSKGNGATHTVIVAPTKGVFRYVPFAVNAAVGDTIMFMWGADNHTVTKSTELLPCNKTTVTPFASGEQNQGFVFTQVVNDTNPTYFYCGTPGHCEKGMFGIINPATSAGDSSVGNMMSNMVANDSTLSSMMTYTNTLVNNNTGAANWGSSIDLASLPEWAHEYALENTLFTRSFLGANPEVMEADGSVNLSNAGSNPYMIPMDLARANEATNAAATSDSSNNVAAAATDSTTPSMTASSGASSPSASTSGAGNISPNVFFAVVAVAATFFAL